MGAGGDEPPTPSTAPAPGASGGEEGTGVGEPRFPPAPRWLTQCPFHLLLGCEMLSLAAFFSPLQTEMKISLHPHASVPQGQPAFARWKFFLRCPQAASPDLKNYEAANTLR